MDRRMVPEPIFAGGDQMLELLRQHATYSKGKAH